MAARKNFFNLHNHDMVRVAVGVPLVRVADPAWNCDRTLELVNRAAAEKAAVVLFPELGLTAYSLDDLFQQRALLDAAIAALERLAKETASAPMMLALGMPLAIDNVLYNCAIMLEGGRVLGVIPKTNLPNYREFYEQRQFASGEVASRTSIDLGAWRDIP